eukprot:TRINITY_DN95074_c0_g1_i1.p1 TRINITY_DN95074_c0_g1~~TRINITY_DN95074_c0_g1_i1.p1  ORF type:complete len:527 (-),score=106.54 TRINITY_DN95074_c0_g1_i1:32-1612(-)
MPQLRGGDWYYDENEKMGYQKDMDKKAEFRQGHRPLNSYKLPKWVYHPERANRRIVINKEDYFGMASDGLRNYDRWNVAHVAAYHDDLKLLSLATPEQCKEPNRWGMTPMHMTGLGQHMHGPSLHVLYELVQMGAADPEAVNGADMTAWHLVQRMQKMAYVKKWEKVVFKGWKPDGFDAWKEAQLRPRGKYARALGLDTSTLPTEDVLKPLPVCLVFPGQGAQYVGMMESLKDIPAVQDMLNTASKVLGYDLADVMSNGPEDKLAQTKFCQPAMYIASLAALEKLRIDEPEKVSRCSSIAGLSVGEYAALTAAGVFDFETGLKIIKARAEAMDFEISGSRPGAKAQAMGLVMGMDRDAVEKLCSACAADAGKGETCQIAACLFSRGYSVGGTETAVNAFIQKAPAAGALQCHVLGLSGAFHTPEMTGVRDYVAKQLEGVKASMRPPKCTVYSNSTAKAIGPNTPVQEIIKTLADQIISPVLWEQSMQQAILDGASEFYEVGPGMQLKGMMKRIDFKIADRMLNVTA